MRIRGLWLLVAGMFMAAGAGAGEGVSVWEQMYGDARTDAQRLNILLKIMDLKDQQSSPFLLRALEDLNNRRIEAGTSNEQYDKITLARLIMQEMGALGVTDAVPLIWDIYRNARFSYLKADAAMALGRMRATDLASHLIRELATLNNPPLDPQTLDEEILAYGLVSSLGNMRQRESFEVLFLASEAWYPPTYRVKETARKVLATLIEDPSDDLLLVAVKNISTPIRTAALKASLASAASPAQKAKVARGILRLSLDRGVNLQSEVLELSRLRLDCMRAMVTLPDNSVEASRILVEIVGRNRVVEPTSYDEALFAITALGYNGHEESLNFLTTRLLEYNELQRKKANNASDLTLVRELVAALKRIGSAKARDVLMRASVIEYDRSMQREMEDAWKSLK